MGTPAITSVFNDGYVAEQLEAYRRDPSSVDESWRQFFRLAEQLGGGSAAGSTAGGGDIATMRAVAGAASLVASIRQYGHLAVQVDPLGSAPPGAAELTPEYHGITEGDLARVPAAALGFDGFSTATEVVRALREAYSGAIGYELEHIASDDEREWLRHAIETREFTRPLDADSKKRLLARLTEVDGLERFLGFAFQGKKRFSIEGTDALVPILDAAIDGAARRGARKVVIGMAHRGRLNVLAHVLGKPYAALFTEFEGRRQGSQPESETGDVKYHMGFRGTRTIDGAAVEVSLVPNPSHLEVVNPVVAGVARALERTLPAERREAAVLPILVHGDSAFAGEGVVAETLNMSRLRGYSVGGTLHVITNNQVGFTTDPIDARSTHYASDLAKGFEIPVLHVNGDDVEACVAAVAMCIAYRERFRKDILIDLVGYRRHGHNETDEPSFTQPELYKLVKAHPTPRQVWGRRLVREGVVGDADVEKVDREFAAKLGRILDEMRAAGVAAANGDPGKPAVAPLPNGAPETAVPIARLSALNEALLAWPSDLQPHRNVAKTLGRRREALGGAAAIDWGHAEALAFASLVADGTSVRITGQDAERGTFSHRQAVLHDMETGKTFTPLAHLPEAKGTFEVYNSPLAETAVMGFEYGFSTAAADTLVLWEAQYGDFVNVAQPIMDQFVFADRAKWGQSSGLVLLLPHGYEGGGPEHSSARLERFLQACAEGNMIVAYPSTPAQYFHILRRQARLAQRRPMVLMQPKSLLRMPEAAARADDLASGRFHPVIDDPIASQQREQVRRLVFCTAKMYYDLAAARQDGAVALIRVDELYPWPHEEIGRVVDLYPAVEDVVWAQEEPKNMGGWTYVAPRLRALVGNIQEMRYVGRPERASPAEGYEAAHKAEQARIVAEALSAPAPSKRRVASSRSA
ncbi:MAG TPA: 2-oxoglutarate dehydrogenase E1 component [Gemmatimonadaceae bacterium]|nr:2-oxoglutarate dehydrogenase E1 component [Gemmatimonadaceae bacterium]